MSTSITNIDILTADRSAAIGSIGDVRNFVKRATVKGKLMQSEALTVQLVAGANTFDAIRELVYGQVLDITTWTNQYFITKVRRNYPDAGGLQIEARAYWERLKFSRAKRTYSENKRVDRVFTIYNRTAEGALADIMDSAPSGFSAGSVATLSSEQKTALLSLSLEDDTHWVAIEKLCAAIQNKTGIACEFYFTRSGDTYEVNLVQQVGISGNRSVKAGGGNASSPSNRLNLQRTTHGDKYFSRLSAVMGNESENITLGRDFDGRPIHWDVETIDLVVDAGTATLTLSGEPVPYDDWGTIQGGDSPHYFGNEAEGFFRILDSTYPNTIKVRTGKTEITDGYFATDSKGTALDFIRANGVEDDHGIVEQKQGVQGVAFPNLIRRAGDSDDMETFVSGVPKGWSAVGSPTIAQIQDERYANIGTNAAQVQADIGQGIRSAFYEVRGGLVSALARIAVEAGEVQIRLVDEEGNTFPGPEEGQAVSSSRALQALALGVWNAFEGTVAIELLATKPDTVFYLDGITLTPSNGSFDWASVMGGRELWAEAGRLLTLDGGGVFTELQGESIDLSEVTGIAGFDAFELGALVTIQDGYQDGVHDVNVSTRVMEFEKSIIGMAPEARWTAEAVREDFVDYLRAGKPVRPRPLPQSPTTPRFAPKLAVEREDVADADGLGNPGVQFSLFPKTSKNEDLENWKIFVSVDGATFSLIATDDDSLAPDAASAYYVGGGYVATLGTTATTTYSVTYPSDDGSVKNVRFYVENRSTGLISTPISFDVRNPELAAAQVTGSLVATQLTEAAQTYGKTFDFDATDNDTVEWGAGTLTFASGTSYNINAGSTGNMPAGTLHYIYLDTGVSTTTLQTTTTNANAVGDNKTLLAVARTSLISGTAFFIDAVGVLNITNEQLAVDSVDTNQLRANSVTAVAIAAASVEAIAIAANTITTDKLAFTPLTSTSTLDDLQDGSAYGRVSLSGLSASLPLLSAAVGDLDDLDDGATFGKVNVTSITNGNILLAQATGDLDDIANGTNFGRVDITQITAGRISLTTIDGNLDDIDDGTTHEKVLASALSAGTVLLAQTSGDLDDVGDGTSFGRVNAASLSSGNILMTSVVGDLDDIADGTYAKVLATSISAGKILLAEATGDLDNVGDGTTYNKVLATSMSSGKILLSAALGDLGDISGDLDDISDGTLFERVNASAVSAGDVLLSAASGNLDDIASGTTYGRIRNTALSSGNPRLDAATGDLDDIDDGGTYERVLGTSVTAGKIILTEVQGDLDDIADGTYAKVLATKVSAGSIILAETTGNLGDIPDGGTYAKVKSTQLSSGLIVIQGESGETIISGGVLQNDSITTNHLSVSTLSGISADLGTITAGSISVGDNTWNSAGLSFTRGSFNLTTKADGTNYTNTVEIQDTGLVVSSSGGNLSSLQPLQLTTTTVVCSQVRMGGNDLDVSGSTLRWDANDVLVDNFISGTFTTADGKTVTVAKGQVTAIT